MHCVALCMAGGWGHTWSWSCTTLPTSSSSLVSYSCSPLSLMMKTSLLGMQCIALHYLWPLEEKESQSIFTGALNSSVIWLLCWNISMHFHAGHHPHHHLEWFDWDAVSSGSLVTPIATPIPDTAPTAPVGPAIYFLTFLIAFIVWISYLFLSTNNSLKLYSFFMQYHTCPPHTSSRLATTSFWLKKDALLFLISVCICQSLKTMAKFTHKMDE